MQIPPSLLVQTRGQSAYPLVSLFLAMADRQGIVETVAAQTAGGDDSSTVVDAAVLIRDIEPFRQSRPVWDRAAEMILVAADTRNRTDVQEATWQLLVALKAGKLGSVSSCQVKR